jgi:hypothetical protein
MGLLKLLAYCLVGFVVYEFIQGMMEDNSGGQNGGGGRARSDLDRAMEEDPGRMQNMTGPGRGTRVETHDAAGMSSPHLVGRGVVQ